MGWKDFKKTGQVQADSKLSSLGLLIVDDEKSIVTTLEESFRGLFKIYTATSGPDALKIFKDNDIHLIVSDQRMPDMTGIELFSRIKEINPNTIRILLTGYADINAVIRGVNEGLLWKYVTKREQKKLNLKLKLTLWLMPIVCGHPIATCTSMKPAWK